MRKFCDILCFGSMQKSLKLFSFVLLISRIVDVSNGLPAELSTQQTRETRELWNCFWPLFFLFFSICDDLHKNSAKFQKLLNLPIYSLKTTMHQKFNRVRRPVESRANWFKFKKTATFPRPAHNFRTFSPTFPFSVRRSHFPIESAQHVMWWRQNIKTLQITFTPKSVL